MVNSADLSGKLAIDANGLNNLKLAAKDNSPEAIKAVAKQFESIFVNMMMKSMRDATPQDGEFDNEQTRTFTAMLDQQLSQSMSSKGIGLAEVLTRQLSGYTPKPQDSLEQAVNNLKFSQNDGYYYKNPYAAGGLTADSDAIASSSKNSADSSASPTAFQNTMSSHAEEASKTTGIPASFMLGQAALESGWGKREIKGSNGEQSYNLFGIKATGNWTGKVVEATTTEYVNGVKQTKVEKFRAYDSYADSFKDFANLMQNNPRYANVMNNLQNPNGYAQAIQDAGYATDPNYASKLSRVIQKVSSA
ncbi:MAG: flagellar assembly peptidoglycan hydrolase FlgJ [Methylophilaceae bacterium]